MTDHALLLLLVPLVALNGRKRVKELPWPTTAFITFIIYDDTLERRIVFICCRFVPESGLLIVRGYSVLLYVFVPL